MQVWTRSAHVGPAKSGVHAQAAAKVALLASPAPALASAPALRLAGTRKHVPWSEHGLAAHGVGTLQSAPAYAGGQRQVAARLPSAAGTHVPPCMHGSASHGGTAAAQSGPVNPNGHTQV